VQFSAWHLIMPWYAFRAACCERYTIHLLELA
jgi:hypothetical protein